MTPATGAAVFAVDPVGLGGVVLRAASAQAREDWLAALRELLPTRGPLRRIPLHIDDSALLGGLDLGATLQMGRPVVRPGLLAQVDGSVLVLPMAERASPALAARIASVLDSGEVVLQRDGVALAHPARIGLVLYDEARDADESVPAALSDRLALHLDLDLGAGDALHGLPWPDRSDIEAAQQRLPRVTCGDAILQALCAAAHALGVASLRAPLLAVRVARVLAALDGAKDVTTEHASAAAQLVLGPRATRVPAADGDEAGLEDDAPQEPQEASEPSDPPSPGEAPPPATDSTADDEASRAPEPQDLADAVLAAARATLPGGLLASLAMGRAAQAQGPAGRGGAEQRAVRRGRPIGSWRGMPRSGARLDLIATLRAAAPWQALRAREWAQRGAAAGTAPRIHVRPGDFHVTRLRQRSRTTTVFLVDASGSAALQRLAEAKGAVELLLADCYVRRDEVAVLAFRGQSAEVLLPPTRSLARAKRSLAALPGGGGTPLAIAFDAAAALTEAIRRRGGTPVLVVLTDGRANIARDGSPGRQKAGEDALAAARQLRGAGVPSLLLDTSPEPQPVARALAEAMGATYVPLPYANAQGMTRAVRAAAA